MVDNSESNPNTSQLIYETGRGCPSRGFQPHYPPLCPPAIDTRPGPPSCDRAAGPPAPGQPALLGADSLCKPTPQRLELHFRFSKAISAHLPQAPGQHGDLPPRGSAQVPLVRAPSSRGVSLEATHLAQGSGSTPLPQAGMGQKAGARAPHTKATTSTQVSVL